MFAVTQTVGIVAADARLTQGGIGINVDAEAATWVPRLPAARPNTSWPGHTMVTFPSNGKGGPTAMTIPPQSPPANQRDH